MDLSGDLQPVVVLSRSDRMATARHDGSAEGTPTRRGTGKDLHSNTAAAPRTTPDSSASHQAKSAKSSKSIREPRSKSRKTPKGTKQTEKMKEDVSVCEDDTIKAHASKRKPSTKSQGSGMKEDQDDARPKVRRSRKRAAVSSPPRDTTAAVEADVALSTTPSAPAGSDSGAKTSSSTPTGARSKVRYAVGRKGESSVSFGGELVPQCTMQWPLLHIV